MKMNKKKKNRSHRYGIDLGLDMDSDILNVNSIPL